MGQLCSATNDDKKRKKSQMKSEVASHRATHTGLHEQSPNHYTKQRDSLSHTGVMEQDNQKTAQTMEAIREELPAEVNYNENKAKQEASPVPEKDDVLRFKEEEEENKIDEISEPIQAAKPLESDYEEDSCAICLESFRSLNQNPTFIKCGHYFCLKCISGALAIRPYCPLCRAYQPKNVLTGEEGNNDEEEAREELLESDWNVEMVRAHLTEHYDEEGFRRVVLSNGEKTNIRVGQGAKITVAPTANLFINGKKVENPQDCNVQ